MRTHSREGFTLTEIIIALAIMGVVFSAALTAVDSAEGTVQQTVGRSVLNTKANRTLARIANRLTGAGAVALNSFPSLPDAADSIEYREVTGFNGTAPLWSEDRAIRLEYETGELNNGIDDDGDGLIDECRVVAIRDEGGANEQRLILATRVAEFLDGEAPDLIDNNGNGLVDERGLCLTREGDVLTVRLTVLHPNNGGVIDARTSLTTIALRN